MSTYQARAVRAGRIWRIHLPGIAVVEADSKADVVSLVRDVVATVRGVEPETVQISVQFYDGTPAARGRRASS